MTVTSSPDLAAIVAEVKDGLRGPLRQIDVAEEEIDAAMKRHPDQADDVYHAFLLLRGTHPLMDTMAVYRAHCRELLDRVAAGTDTRPGTDAEICCVASDASQLAPMNTTGTGLYARAFAAVFPDKYPEIWGDQAPHYEALRGGEIDAETARVRGKLSLADRRMKTPPECPGTHHGIEVNCRYAKPEEEAS